MSIIDEELQIKSDSFLQLDRSCISQVSFIIQSSSFILGLPVAFFVFIIRSIPFVEESHCSVRVLPSSHVLDCFVVLFLSHLQYFCIRFMIHPFYLPSPIATVQMSNASSYLVYFLFFLHCLPFLSIYCSTQYNVFTSYSSDILEPSVLPSLVIEIVCIVFSLGKLKELVKDRYSAK